MRRKLPAICSLVLGLVMIVPSATADPGAGAVVLVNSASAAYPDFQHYVKPYLDNFGVPYATVDIATTPVPASIGDYAVIIVGHRQLDPGHAYLDSTEQTYISAGVNTGAGLVNFDNDLSGDGVTARYQFVNTLFGFGYVGATSGSGVSFPDPTAHYITQRHTSGSIGTGSMTLAGVTLPGSVTAVATTGTQPLLAVTTYGAGRAVQWGSCDWMRNSVLGSMYGLDDLVWRGIVWAARKPFVMQGLPPFVTMRVDDESGNFEWIHIANEFGIKPWAGLFFHNIDDTEAADLSALVLAGKATASIHAKDTNTFFYFDHGAVADFSDAAVAANFAEGTAWHATKNIPIAKFVLGHYYELGDNAFQGLHNWGVEFVGTEEDPGRGYGDSWVMNGPFRLYETGSSRDVRPHYYADYLSVPGHSEFSGTFFNCVTEIRDDAGYEWYPTLTDVPGTIGRGTRQTIRALDAMALPTLFTHGVYISGMWDAAAPAEWRAILTGITANLASYNPIYVTMDDACRYVRAVHNSDISTAVYDSGNNRLTANLTGSTDVTTKFYVFTGNGNAISYALVDVPQFTGSTQVVYTLPGPLDHIVVSPNPATVVAGASRQLTGAGFDASGNPIPNLQFVWTVVNGGGSIDASGLFTAGVTTGTYANTAAATFGAIQGFATVTVTEPILDHLDFATIGTPKSRNAPFTVTITARDAGGNRVLGYSGMGVLTDTTGTVTPSSIGPFVAGVWSGPVTIGAEATNVTLTVNATGAIGVSNAFNVAAPIQGAVSIWPTAPIPSGAWVNDPLPVELGVKFRSATDGYITALRFYKNASNTGIHIGHLFDAAGNLLATATFTNETSSGWQEVALTPRVSIQADRTYVASYHSTTGYSADRPYFATAGVDSPPLRALRDGEDGGNGVYKYDNTCSIPPCVPNLSSQSSNYWIDVVFLTPDGTPPTVASTSPVGGAAGVNVFASITATFSEAMAPATITTSTFTVREVGGTSDVPAVVTYAGLTATLDPVGTLAVGKSYRATVAGTVTDVAGNPLGSDYSWTFDTAVVSPCPCNIWPSAPTPATPWVNDVNAIEVGVKFRSAVGGSITGLGFYKGGSNTGAHVGHLWDSAGTLLAQATFTNETASGWQEVALIPRVVITANTTYIASYHTATGYASDRPFFAASGVDNPPLRALRDGEDGGNGVYKYDSTCSTPPCVPNLTYQSTNYWVDVVFNLPDTTPPTVTGVVPPNGAIGVDVSANVTATFSEAINPATITSSTFRLREAGAGNDVPAVVTYTGFTATLDPVSPLSPGRNYQVTVSGAVADYDNNPLGTDDIWSFSTASISSLSDTTSADFAAALTNTCSVVAHTGDGEVTLVPALAEEFSQASGLPAGWLSYVWNTGGSAGVSGGKLILNGARAEPDPANNNYGPGRSLEFSATFSGGTIKNQQAGFGGGNNAPPGEIYNSPPLATFTTTSTGTNLYARAYVSLNNDFVSNALTGSYFDAPHRYRIVWNTSSVDYSIDGNAPYTWSKTVAGSMRPAFSVYLYTANKPLTVDWMRMSPYAAPCTLESRVLDAGRVANWIGLTATGSRPTGTAYSLETRSGNTASPGDGTWSAWQAVTGTTIASPDARYLQYRATLTTADTLVTPELQRVDITTDLCTPEVCDGVDNDCDGVIDNGNPGGGGACSTGQSGVCAAGTQQCTGGALVCVRSVSPSVETCNGLDDDCDGAVDNGLSRATTCGLGVCHSTGTETCSAGLWVGNTCTPGQPATETCNGLDDDCDGAVDNGLTRATSCGVGACHRTGTQTCSAGQWVGDTCTPGQPTTETCNAIDDDCDGSVDEGDPGGGAACVTGQLGVCSPGTMHCASGVVACQRNTEPSAETCNGFDDDCNGAVDDGLTASMSIADGVVGRPGDTITVPIQLSDVTGKGAYSAQMDVAFDATVLSPLSVGSGAALAGRPCTLVANLAIPGHVRLAIFCEQPLAGSGSLADVSFSVATPIYGRTTGLSFATAKLNEGCPAVLPDPGSFIVRGPEICDGQDNDGIGGIDEICTVSGAVHYYRDDLTSSEPSDKPVPNVGIDLSGTVPSQTTTDGNGAYLFGGLHGSVTVAPMQKSGDRNGAISSLDAAAVAMAAVGNGPLSVNQVFAGDVTGNHSISALDASYIARLSVGLVPRFPVAEAANSDWMFLKCVPDYAGTCGDPTYTINPITGPQPAQDFFAILYGDVTGNWPQAGTFASSLNAFSPDEGAAIVRDLELTDRFRREGEPPVIERPSGMPPAELSLSGWKALRAGERAQLTVDLRHADGILGLDLVLRFDPSRLAIVDVQAAGIGSALNVSRADRGGPERIAAYGYAALSGSGSILTITVEGLHNKGRPLPPTIGGVANEGAIPLEVNGSMSAPRVEREK